MAKFTGLYVAHDAEIYKDLEHGRITPGMKDVYSMILFQCDYETGFWYGDIQKLYDGFGGQVGRKTLENNLRKLFKTGHLKSFHIQGKKSFYDIGIHGYKVRFWRAVSGWPDTRRP